MNERSPVDAFLSNKATDWSEKEPINVRLPSFEKEIEEGLGIIFSTFNCPANVGRLPG